MALCARIHLLFTRHPRRIHDGGPPQCVEHRAFARHVVAATCMAPLTRDSCNRAVWPVAIHHCGLWHRLQPGRVAFQAARRDATLEIGAPRAISVAWTHDPGIDAVPEREGKLEELIALPVEKSLAFATGADHQSNSLRARHRILPCTDDCGLVVSRRTGINPEMRIATYAENLMRARRKARSHALSCRDTRGAAMRGALE
jgi:hypothetical protein